MTYAVVQATLEKPTLTQLRDGLRAALAAAGDFPYTPADAGPVRRDAFGILLEGLTVGQARLGQRELARVGYATHIVDEQQLLDLPPTQTRRVVEPNPDGLLLRDPLDRPEIIGYDHVVLVAAGMVGDQRFARERRRVPGTGNERSPAIYLLNVTETTDYEQRLDMLFDCPPWRIRAYGHRLTYACLGAEVTNRAEINFMHLVRRLGQHLAPGILTRGAAAVAHLDDTVAVYPTARAFEEELIWHYWYAVHAEGT